MRTLRLTLTTFASISLLVSGCGSSDDNSTTSTGAGTGGQAGSGGAGVGGSAGHSTGGTGGAAGHTTGGAGGAAGHATGTGGGGTTGAGGKATGGGGTTGGSGGTTGGSGGTTGGTGGTTGGTAGTGTGGSAGAGGSDMCSGGAGSTAPPGLPAVRLADNAASFVLATTTTGLVVTYEIDAAQTLTIKASKLDGTMSQIITMGAVQLTMFRGRDVLFYWTGYDDPATKKTGKLSVWTETGGSKVLAATGAPLPPPAASATSAQSDVVFVSADNSTIVYAANAPTTGATADLIRADVDGSNPVTLATTSLANQAKCTTSITDSADVMVAGVCDAANVTSYYSIKKGAAAPALVAIDPGATVTYETAGKTIFAISKTGDGVAYDLAGVPVTGGGGAGGAGGAGGGNGGPTGTLIDTGVGAGAGAMVNAIPHYSKDGSTIFYPTKDKRFRKSSVTAPVPSDVVAGVNFVWPNHNDTMSFVSKMFDPKGTGDLFLVDETTGTTTPVSASIKSALFTSAFSADNTTLLFWDKVDITVGVGQFETAPLTGAPVVTRGDFNGWDVVALEGTRVVYNDNYLAQLNMMAGTYGTSDIKLVDVAGMGPETLVVSGGNAVFRVSEDKKYVVYDYADPCGNGDVTGAYAAKIPLVVVSGSSSGAVGRQRDRRLRRFQGRRRKPLREDRARMLRAHLN